MQDRVFVPLRSMAFRLGLSAQWLKHEAEKGAVPALRTGRRWMFNPDLVQEHLKKRSATSMLPPPTN